MVLALPRGGVVVGYEVAVALGAPLDVLVARKLGSPGNPEFGFGALAPGGARYLNEDTVRLLHLSEEEIERIAEREMREMRRRAEVYRAGGPEPDVAGRTAILVDDGLATGATARAAVAAVRRCDPGALVLAVPVSAPDTAAALRREVDELVCPLVPPGFMAVGQWYADFTQTTDAEVVELLRRAAERPD
jgi:predicted phosphoribosyltransferase